MSQTRSELPFEHSHSDETAAKHSDSAQPAGSTGNSSSVEDSESAPGPNESTTLSGIWNSPCGPREVLAVGLPLIVSTLSYSVMQFCDRLFLSWYGQLEMAAVMPAVVLNWTAASLPMGIASYAATFVAQYEGSKRQKKIGAMIWTACWLGIYFVPAFALLSFFSDQVFILFGHEAELIPLESVYFKIACYGSAAVVFESALSSFFIGQGRTTIVMVINLIAMLINLVLDWSFIFGFWIIPEMGIAGAAWATTISVWLKVICYFMLIARRKNMKRFGLSRGIRPNWIQMKRLLKFGGPSGWQLWMEGMAISLFVLFIGRIGIVESAATTLAFSVNLIAFIPVVGLGMSVSTLVGQKIGSQEIHLARRAVFYGLMIGLIYSSLFAVLYFAVPHLFLMAHASTALGDSFAEIESTAIFLLKFVATYCIFDCIQIIYASALKGAGDTQFIFIFTIINAILFVALGLAGITLLTADSPAVVWLMGAEHVDDFELTWWWIVITVWILVYALVFFLRFLGGKWTRMSVIDVIRSKSN